jgi:hypothetical protein
LKKSEEVNARSRRRSENIYTVQAGWVDGMRMLTQRQRSNEKGGGNTTRPMQQQLETKHDSERHGPIRILLYVTAQNTLSPQESSMAIGRPLHGSLWASGADFIQSVTSSRQNLTLLSAFALWLAVMLLFSPHLPSMVSSWSDMLPWHACHLPYRCHCRLT